MKSSLPHTWTPEEIALIKLTVREVVLDNKLINKRLDKLTGGESVPMSDLDTCRNELSEALDTITNQAAEMDHLGETNSRLASIIKDLRADMVSNVDTSIDSRKELSEALDTITNQAAEMDHLEEMIDAQSLTTDSLSSDLSRAGELHDKLVSKCKTGEVKYKELHIKYLELESNHIILNEAYNDMRVEHNGREALEPKAPPKPSIVTSSESISPPPLKIPSPTQRLKNILKNTFKLPN